MSYSIDFILNHDRKANRINWEHVGIFKSLEEAKEKIRGEWVKSTTYKAKDKVKYIMLCKNRIKYNCKATLRIENFKDKNFNVFKAHSHKFECMECKRPFSNDIRKLVLQLFQSGVVNPMDIKMSLEYGNVFIAYKDICNFLSYYCNSHY